MRKLITLTLGCAMAASATAAIAAEITGNGKVLEIHARTECAYSGLNDLDGDPRDPGFRTQNYGQNVRLTPLDPSTLDPNADAFFVPIPGFACNPNRYHDLHAGD